MLLDRAPSWRQRRWPQSVNEAQDLSEQRSWDGDLHQLESDTAAVAHDLGADLDQLLAEPFLRTGRSPALAITRVLKPLILGTHLLSRIFD